MFLLIYPTFREVITKLLYLHFKHLLLYDMPPCNINTRAQYTYSHMLSFYNGGHGGAVTIERRCEMLKSCRLECITSEVDSIIAQWFIDARYGEMYT
jgi:hypothetical protein